MCQKYILSRVIAPTSNVTLIIKKLVGKKLVTVTTSEIDKCEYKINITKRGHELLTVVDAHLASSIKSISTLSESEASQMNALLEKLREE